MGNMTQASDYMYMQVPCHHNVAISVPTNYFSINYSSIKHFFEDKREAYAENTRENELWLP